MDFLFFALRNSLKLLVQLKQQQHVKNSRTGLIKFKKFIPHSIEIV